MVKRAYRDDMTPMDWDVVGGHYTRLLVPLGDRAMMMEVARELKQLAFQIEISVRGIRDLPLRSALVRARQHLDFANREMRQIAGRYGAEIKVGRPKSGGREGRRSID